MRWRIDGDTLSFERDDIARGRSHAGRDQAVDPAAMTATASSSRTPPLGSLDTTVRPTTLVACGAATADGGSSAVTIAPRATNPHDESDGGGGPVAGAVALRRPRATPAQAQFGGERTPNAEPTSGRQLCAIAARTVR